MRLCCYTRLVAMWAPVWPSESGRATCPVIVTFIREWTCLTRETVIVSPEFDNTERRGDTAVRRICEFLFFHVENLSLKIKEAYTHITIDGLRKRIRIIIIFFSFNQLELFEKKLTRNIRTAFLFNEDLINNKPYHCELLFIVESKDIHSSWNILIIIFEKKKKEKIVTRVFLCKYFNAYDSIQGETWSTKGLLEFWTNGQSRNRFQLNDISFVKLAALYSFLRVFSPCVHAYVQQ